jgi:signal transduction histidine kinase
MVEAMRPERAPGAGFWLAGRFTPRQVDWMVLGAAVLLSLPAVLHAGLVGSRPAVVSLVTVPLATVPLLWRRSHPGLVLATLAAALAVPAALARREPYSVALLFAVGSAALYGDRRVRVVAGVGALGALVLAFGVVLATGEARPLGHLAGTAFGSGVAWVVGDRTRTRRAYLAQLEERAARLEREREDHARRATEEERNRIARELHDVVAHNVSVIAVQAGAARMTSGGDPELANQTLGLIERTARSTLAELRALLGILRRHDGEPTGRGPQPTLAQLDVLVAQAREAGLRVQARVQGDLGGLPATVDLSAYRIVQEALTNVLKHAPGSRVHLLVRRAPGAIDLVVVDDGPGGLPDASGGQGLIGMRERAALVGGRLSAGPALGGGFRVQARLPVEGPRAAGDVSGAGQRPAEAALP